MEARLTFLNLVLVVNDFEHTRSKLRSQLAKNAIGFKGLND